MVDQEKRCFPDVNSLEDFFGVRYLDDGNYRRIHISNKPIIGCALFTFGRVYFIEYFEKTILEQSCYDYPSKRGALRWLQDKTNLFLARFPKDSCFLEDQCSNNSLLESSTLLD